VVLETAIEALHRPVVVAVDTPLLRIIIVMNLAGALLVIGMVVTILLLLVDQDITMTIAVLLLCATAVVLLPLTFAEDEGCLLVGGNVTVVCLLLRECGAEVARGVLLETDAIGFMVMFAMTAIKIVARTITIDLTVDEAPIAVALVA